MKDLKIQLKKQDNNKVIDSKLIMSFEYHDLSEVFFEKKAHRNSDVSFVERSLKIIDSKKYQKYLICFAEIKMTMFLNALIILISRRDF